MKGLRAAGGLPCGHAVDMMPHAWRQVVANPRTGLALPALALHSHTPVTHTPSTNKQPGCQVSRYLAQSVRLHKPARAVLLLLQQVLAGGNDSQRQRAQEILGRLA